jgi:hypothetical protein
LIRYIKKKEAGMSRITLVLALMASFLVCAGCSERGTSSESPSLAKGISAQERRALVALYEPQKETQTIGAIAHRHCRLIWLILHQGVRYEERGPAVSQKSKQARTIF